MEKDRPKVGMGVFILNDEGQTLFIKRTSKHEYGTWAPAGGYFEYGESFLEGANRELKEELNIQTESVKIIGVENTVYEKEGKHIIAVEFLAGKIIGTPEIMEPDKCAEIGWFDLNNLPEPMMRPTQSFLSHNCICNSGKPLKECHGK